MLHCPLTRHAPSFDTVSLIGSPCSVMAVDPAVPAEDQCQSNTRSVGLSPTGSMVLAVLLQCSRAFEYPLQERYHESYTTKCNTGVQKNYTDLGTLWRSMWILCSGMAYNFAVLKIAHFPEILPHHELWITLVGHIMVCTAEIVVDLF
ncbi:hypothetical protein BASA83_008586 [Batrachochytrium salamandrivorans]|nr:hypothetical protein BASA83_008586 [Batrachochytrium salamandrivorans]